MKKIFCIATGSYSDWNIKYAFESESKRDSMFEVVKGYDVEKYEIELDDERISLNEIEEKFYIFLTDYRVAKLKLDPIEAKGYKKVCIHYRTGLSHLNLEISKEEFELSDDKLYEKYSKVFQDTLAIVEYMRQVEDIEYEEIKKLLNGDTDEI